MSFNEGDEVITLVSDPDIPKGTYGVISGVEEDRCIRARGSENAM